MRVLCVGLCEFRPADAHRFCSPFSIGAVSLDPDGLCPSASGDFSQVTSDLRAGHSLDRPFVPVPEASACALRGFTLVCAGGGATAVISRCSQQEHVVGEHGLVTPGPQ